jgi:hypothetical protein
MSISNIAITPGSGAKNLATSAVVQDETTVEVQRVLTENFATAGAESYAITVSPTSPTSAGVILAIENDDSNGKSVYVSRIEIVQTGDASPAANVQFRVGRGAALGTGGTTDTPIGLNPGAGAAATLVRASSSATPNTGITAPTGADIYATRFGHFHNDETAFKVITFDFASMLPGQLPAVPVDTTGPLTLAVSGSLDGATIAINVVTLELEV